MFFIMSTFHVIGNPVLVRKKAGIAFIEGDPLSQSAHNSELMNPFKTSLSAYR